MTNKKLALILLAVSAVLITGFGIAKLTSKKANAPAASDQPTSQQTANNGSASQSASQNSTANEASTFTTSEVKKHNSATDCWTIINGKVYDITEYIPRHPGGDEILRACGNDGTSLFTQRTTSDGETVGSGTSHSSSAESQLEQFFVGELKD